DKLPPDDELRIADARRKLLSAAKNLAQRSFREAAIDAVEGQEALWRGAPRAAPPPVAGVEPPLGPAGAGEQKDAEAREAFALTLRLDPNRTLDERRYVPEVIRRSRPPGRSSPGSARSSCAAPARSGSTATRSARHPASFPRCSAATWCGSP